MATAKKVAAKKAAAKPATPTAAAPAPAPAPAAAKKASNAAFMKPMTPSAALSAIVGKKALPRTEVTSKVWEYIKKHGLQDATNRRQINADEKMKAVLGKDQVSMFEMTRLISAHLS
jgi:upstream activation factor subunit UAF30